MLGACSQLLSVQVGSELWCDLCSRHPLVLAPGSLHISGMEEMGP